MIRTIKLAHLNTLENVGRWWQLIANPPFQWVRSSGWVEIGKTEVRNADSREKCCSWPINSQQKIRKTANGKRIKQFTIYFL